MIVYKIRDATQNDFEDAFNIKKDALQSYVEKTWGWNEEFQSNYHKKHFEPKNLKIIEVESKPIGSLKFITEKDHIFLSELFIMQAYQSKKIGSRIINDYIYNAYTEKKTVKLQVLRINKRAVKLYKKLCFEIYEEDNVYFKMIYRHEQ
ncbi:MAG: GNAT family N-acetyltransferase [Ignavibacteria bacterium]|nr:GNAT family N-acetyltransferase [Ignavibacteria bacterium]